MLCDISPVLSDMNDAMVQCVHNYRRKYFNGLLQLCFSKMTFRVWLAIKLSDLAPAAMLFLLRYYANVSAGSHPWDGWRIFYFSPFVSQTYRSTAVDRHPKYIKNMFHVKRANGCPSSFGMWLYCAVSLHCKATASTLFTSICFLNCQKSRGRLSINIKCPSHCLLRLGNSNAILNVYLTTVCIQWCGNYFLAGGSTHVL